MYEYIFLSISGPKKVFYGQKLFVVKKVFYILKKLFVVKSPFYILKKLFVVKSFFIY
jgi:hypothetical protein